MSSCVCGIRSFSLGDTKDKCCILFGPEASSIPRRCFGKVGMSKAETKQAEQLSQVHRVCTGSSLGSLPAPWPLRSTARFPPCPTMLCDEAPASAQILLLLWGPRLGCDTGAWSGHRDRYRCSPCHFLSHIRCQCCVKTILQFSSKRLGVIS